MVLERMSALSDRHHVVIAASHARRLPAAPHIIPEISVPPRHARAREIAGNACVMKTMRAVQRPRQIRVCCQFERMVAAAIGSQSSPKTSQPHARERPGAIQCPYMRSRARLPTCHAWYCATLRPGDATIVNRQTRSLRFPDRLDRRPDHQPAEGSVRAAHGSHRSWPPGAVRPPPTGSVRDLRRTCCSRRTVAAARLWPGPRSPSERLAGTGRAAPQPVSRPAAAGCARVHSSAVCRSRRCGTIHRRGVEHRSRRRRTAPCSPRGTRSHQPRACTSIAVPSSSGWPRANTSRPSCGRSSSQRASACAACRVTRCSRSRSASVCGLLLDRCRRGQQQARTQQQQPARHHQPVSASGRAESSAWPAAARRPAGRADPAARCTLGRSAWPAPGASSNASGPSKPDEHQAWRCPSPARRYARIGRDACHAAVSPPAAAAARSSTPASAPPAWRSPSAVSRPPVKNP